MKHKCEFNNSKQIQPIVCLIFDLRYILTKNTWWFGKKSTFSTQNILWRAMAGLLSFPTIIISKNGKKYNFSARAKLRRNRFSHSKTPKHAQNWLFLTVFSFFLFLRSTFFTLWIKNHNFIHQMHHKIPPNDLMWPFLNRRRDFEFWPKTKLSCIQCTVPLPRSGQENVKNSRQVVMFGVILPFYKG